MSLFSFEHLKENRINILEKLKRLDNLKSQFTISPPNTFNEKIQYRMAFDRREVLTKFVDKFQVREYVQRVCGDKYLAEIYQVVRKPEKICWDKLPDNFICKTNHGSGGLIGVWTGVELEAKLPVNINKLGWTRWWVHPDNFDTGAALRMLNYWRKRNYAFHLGGKFEWAYKNLKRRIYIEELLINSNGTIASPWQFFVFSGDVKLVRLSGRDNESVRTFAYVDRDWREVLISIGDEVNRMSQIPEVPLNFGEMLTIAKKLSSSLDFVRVDLYNLSHRIIFSELTVYPSAGMGIISPEEFNTVLGSYWKIELGKKFFDKSN